MTTLKLAFSSWLGFLSGARRASARSGDGSIDRRTSLYNRGGLLAHGKVLLADCRATGRELTLAVFDCSDLVEARTLYGDRTSRKLIDAIVQKLTLVAGPDGLAARTGPTQFAVALPMARERAMDAIERVLGDPTRFELEGCRSEIVLVPHLMVEAVPAAGTVERMFAALCRGLVRVQEEERMRNEYMQRQRERHSRPMPVAPREAAVRPAPRAPVLGPDPVMTHQIPNTIPMPLSAR
jgi:GGDEF domain-containing protein